MKRKFVLLLISVMLAITLFSTTACDGDMSNIGSIINSLLNSADIDELFASWQNNVTIDEIDPTNSNYYNSNTNIESVGLAFSLSDDGTYYILDSVGECTDSDIVIPSSHNELPVKAIASNCFANNKKIKSMFIPSTIDSIGSGAFSDCTGLERISIPSDILNLGVDVLNGCTKLNFNKYDNAVYLGNATNPFAYLLRAIDIKNLEAKISRCVIHKDTEVIYDYAFYEQTDIENILIPASVVAIKDNAFYGCENLKTVKNESSLVFEKGSTDHGYVTYYANKIVLPNKATKSNSIFTSTTAPFSTATTSSFAHTGSVPAIDADGYYCNLMVSNFGIFNVNGGNNVQKTATSGNTLRSFSSCVQFPKNSVSNFYSNSISFAITEPGLFDFYANFSASNSSSVNRNMKLIKLNGDLVETFEFSNNENLASLRKTIISEPGFYALCCQDTTVDWNIYAIRFKRNSQNTSPVYSSPYDYNYSAPTYSVPKYSTSTYSYVNTSPTPISGLYTNLTTAGVGIFKFNGASNKTGNKMADDESQRFTNWVQIGPSNDVGYSNKSVSFTIASAGTLTIYANRSSVIATGTYVPMHVITSDGTEIGTINFPNDGNRSYKMTYHFSSEGSYAITADGTNSGFNIHAIGFSED